ncbi:hypothetical protein chiPu_0016061 [Chiloscyllium punctatum]|uniref:COX assembly mitochondrial protein n=1 Tax=Chiloscyllium punctatum TaxID=137246 RepID=A0A401T4L1_CHIPU|nr:hypothetical protein [Chiloscyllium punctatum]
MSLDRRLNSTILLANPSITHRQIVTSCHAVTQGSGSSLIQKHSFLKFLGKCNDIDREMRRCLELEAKAKRARSREHAARMQRRLNSSSE